MTSALDVQDVTVTFGGIRALSAISLSLDRGEVCGLIGPNGAGKTTLFDVISGVRLPRSGRVLLDGQDITRMTAVKRSRAGMRRTFQAVQVFGWLSVLDNVVAALDPDGGGGGLFGDLVAAPGRRKRQRERRERARAALERCGLSAYADISAGALPIGLARMVELARASVQQPKVLLLDEPASGLDRDEVARLATLVEQIAVEDNCGVLLVEHDMDFVMDRCHRVAVLNLGEVLAQGTPAEIRSNDAVRVAYLGTETGNPDETAATTGTSVPG